MTTFEVVGTKLVGSDGFEWKCHKCGAKAPMLLEGDDTEHEWEILAYCETCLGV